MTLTHKFVENIPKELEDGVVYVSISFETVIHRCCCGCGNEVVTPLSPTDWSITFDGETITLDPSIGNWSFECKSHYFIRKNKVVWARRFSEKEIAEVKYVDNKDKKDYYNRPSIEQSVKVSESKEEFEKSAFLRVRLINWWNNLFKQSE